MFGLSNHSKRKFEAWREEDEVPWSATHTHFANMGGFTVKFGVEINDLATSSNPSPNKNSGGLGLPLNRSISAPSVLDHVTQSLDTSHDISPQALESGASKDKFPRPDIPTVFEPSRDDEYSHHLPESVRAQIDRLLARGVFSPKRIRRSLLRRSHMTGEVDMHIDDTNSALVAETTRHLNYDYFQDNKTWRHFLQVPQEWFSNLHALQGNIWILNAKQLLLARELGIINKLPNVSDDNLGDRNKADLFVKLVVLGQVSSFVLQLIMRLYKRLPTTQLEIMTFGFAICTAMTYFLLLDKPKDVACSITIPAARRPKSAEEMSRLASNGPSPIMIGRMGMDIPNNATPLMFSLQFSIASAVGVLVLGSTHCIAWNFVFPTRIEQIVWRVSSVVTMAAIPLAVAILIMTRAIADCVYHQHGRDRSPMELFVFRFLGLAFSGVYVMARVFVTFEIIRSLAYLPPEAFLTGWPDNLPHVG